VFLDRDTRLDRRRRAARAAADGAFMAEPTAIHGFCDPAFLPLEEAFAANFEAGLEVGASLAATRHGKPVVDLWAGFADRKRVEPWREDTVVTVFSSTIRDRADLSRVAKLTWDITHVFATDSVAERAMGWLEEAPPGERVAMAARGARWTPSPRPPSATP
jgi:hypothetical protein